MKNLDNRYYNEVIAEMQPFFEEQGFKSSADGVFANERCAVKIEYDENGNPTKVTVGILDESTGTKKYKEYSPR